MLIDWFTVVAQIVNFLILVWLLKRFLYGPILNVIDAREKRIAAVLADADAKRDEAQTQRDAFQRRNEAFDRERAALFDQAMDQAKTERQRLLDAARQAADALSAKRQEALRSDAHKLNQAIHRRAQQEVFAIARQALSDLAATSLEERMCAVFTRRLREMDPRAKADFAETLAKAAAPALVRSAFALAPEQRAALQKALDETFSAEIRVRFETAPDLIGGIELATDGQKLAWTIADYLKSLEVRVDELLQAQPQAEVERDTDAKPEADAETSGQQAGGR